MNIKLRPNTFFTKIFHLFFLSGALTLQFYLYESGTLQPSHILFLFSLFIIVTTKGISNTIVTNKTFLRLIYFIFITLFINSFYAIKNLNFDYIKSTSYYIFGIFITYLTIYFLLKSNKKNILKSILSITLFLLLILWYFGYGNYEFLPRYNGFFNDPNQMAHWALCIFVMIALINDNNKLLNYISFIMTGIIILLSLSRSGLMGLFVIFFIMFMPNKKNILIISSITISLLILLYFTNTSENKVFQNFENIITRLTESDLNDQADARGYNRVFQYPEYLVFGSGQAEDFRFKADFEIHSTWMAILFYYGFFTFIYFIYILYKVFTYLTFTQIGVIMGPLIYAFSTFGLRTPVFWMLLGVIIFKSIENNLAVKIKLPVYKLQIQ